MLHTVPIYFANVKVDVYKQTKILTLVKSVFVKNIVLKGFHPVDIANKEFKNIVSKVSLEKKTKSENVFKIKKIELICQLGYGL